MSSAPRPELDKRFDPQSFEMTLVPAPGGVGPVSSGGGARRRPPLHRSSSRRRTSPGAFTSGTPSAGRSRTSSRAGSGCRAGPSSGSPESTTPASRRRWSSSATSRSGRGRPATTSGREPFLEICREWADARRGDILNQIRRLGCSCDFSREYYTLDEPRSKAVRRAFSELYHQGLAYRDSRMVNWCTRCATVLSDLEVNHVESSGHLWSVGLPARGRERGARRRDDAPRDDARRHGGRGPPGGRALHGARREAGPPPADGPAHPRHRGRDGRPDVRDGRREDHAGARPERLRGGAAARPRRDRRDRLRREDDRRGRARRTPASSGPRPARRSSRTSREQGLRRDDKPHTSAVGRCQRCDTVLEPLVSLQWFVKIRPARRQGGRRDRRPARSPSPRSSGRRRTTSG